MTDIVCVTPGDFIVIGFFTPDYRPLATALAGQLGSTSHHFYAVPDEEWQRAILLKPTIVLHGMRDYPLRTLVLMDVDCQMRDDISEWIAGLTTDITLPARIRRGSRRHGRVLFSSRVMAIAPTEASKRLVLNWQALCNSAKAPLFSRLCDERELVGAIGSNHGATIAFTPDEYAGLDASNAPSGAKIVHVSEHAKRFDGVLTQAGKCGQRAFDAIRGKASA